MLALRFRAGHSGHSLTTPMKQSLITSVAVLAVFGLMTSCANKKETMTTTSTSSSTAATTKKDTAAKKETTTTKKAATTTKKTSASPSPTP